MKNRKGEPLLYPSQKGFMNTIGMWPIDPLGSFSGIPEDPDEKPVQDADDL